MRLPNADLAQVSREKITDYLLSASHGDGRSKAEFFSRFGLRTEAWQVMMEAPRVHGVSYPVVRIVESSYGKRYSVDGQLGTPDGRNPRVRTVWIIEEGSMVARLITAHPIGR